MFLFTTWRQLLLVGDTVSKSCLPNSWRHCDSRDAWIRFMYAEWNLSYYCQNEPISCSSVRARSIFWLEMMTQYKTRTTPLGVFPRVLTWYMMTGFQLPPREKRRIPKMPQTHWNSSLLLSTISHSVMRLTLTTFILKRAVSFSVKMTNVNDTLER